MGHKTTVSLFEKVRNRHTHIRSDESQNLGLPHDLGFFKGQLSFSLLL